MGGGGHILELTSVFLIINILMRGKGQLKIWNLSEGDW